MANKRPSVAKMDWKLTLKSRKRHNSYYFTTRKAMDNFLQLNSVHGDSVLVEKGRFRKVKAWKV